MTWRPLFAAALALLLVPIRAVIEEFHYASNATGFTCPGMPFKCEPPNVCSRDTLLNKYYCCDPGKGNVCWTGSETCSGQGGTQPGATQTGCDVQGGGTFCCLSKREECTQVKNQINICWAPENPLSSLSPALSNDTFSSLSATSPSATAWKLDLQSLLTPSSTAASSSSSTTPPASTSHTTIGTSSASALPSGTVTTPTSSSNPPILFSDPPPRSSTPLSTGEIAGIAIGAMGALFFLLAGLFLLWRRKGRRNNNKKAVELYADYAYRGHVSAVEKYAHFAGQEMEVSSPRAELEGSGLEPVELPCGEEGYGKRKLESRGKR